MRGFLHGTLQVVRHGSGLRVNGSPRNRLIAGAPLRGEAMGGIVVAERCLTPPMRDEAANEWAPVVLVVGLWVGHPARVKGWGLWWEAFRSRRCAGRRWTEQCGVPGSSCKPTSQRRDVGHPLLWSP